VQDIYSEIVKFLERRRNWHLPRPLPHRFCSQAVGAKYLIKADGTLLAPLEEDVLRQRFGKRLRR
jgi:hypothetical protein